MKRVVRSVRIGENEGRASEGFLFFYLGFLLRFKLNCSFFFKNPFAFYKQEQVYF